MVNEGVNEHNREEPIHAPENICWTRKIGWQSRKGDWGRYFILWDIVDPRTESNPKPEPKPKPEPNPNPNPDPNCGFTISHKMKYLRQLSLRHSRSRAQKLGAKFCVFPNYTGYDIG